MQAKKLLLLLLFLGLLGFASFNYIFFYFWMQQQKSVSRIAALQSGNCVEVLNVENYELFRNGKGIIWKDANKEVVIDGVYYEVLKVKRGATASKIFIVADDKETRRHSGFFAMQTKMGKELANIFKLFSGLVFFGSIIPLLFLPRPTAPLVFKKLNNLYSFSFSLKLYRPPCV